MGAQVEVRSCAGCTPTTAELVGNSVASAFVFEPAPVPFAPSPCIEQHGFRHAVLRNITWRPVTITQLSTTDISFTPLGSLAGQRSVSRASPCSCRWSSRRAARARHRGRSPWRYESDKPRQSQVMLDARGGRPTLAVAPLSLDFGELPVGGKVAQTIRISNAGTHREPATSAACGAAGTRPTSPWACPSAASSPTRGRAAPGPPRSRRTIGHRAGRRTRWTHGLLRAPGRGHLPGHAHAALGRALHPRAHHRPHGPGARQPARASTSCGPSRRWTSATCRRAGARCWASTSRNPGRAECAVKDIHLSNDAGGAFFMPGGALTGGVMPLRHGLQRAGGLPSARARATSRAS